MLAALGLLCAGPLHGQAGGHEAAQRKRFTEFWIVDRLLVRVDTGDLIAKLPGPRSCDAMVGGSLVMRWTLDVSGPQMPMNDRSWVMVDSIVPCRYEGQTAIPMSGVVVATDSGRAEIQRSKTWWLVSTAKRLFPGIPHYEAQERGDSLFVWDRLDPTRRRVYRRR